MPDQVELSAPFSGVSADALDHTIAAASTRLLSHQKADGHWSYELEADATIPAEYIILNHFLGEIDDALEGRLARYLRSHQTASGGWPLFAGGEDNASCSVKAYFALKLVGDDVEAPHMKHARAAILRLGGLPGCNVFTRITLALFGIVPWRAVPMTRPEILFAPRWFPIHIEKVSYWTRTVMVPLLVLTGLRAKAKNPRGIGLAELEPANPNYALHNPTGTLLGSVLLALDTLARPFEPLIPRKLTERAAARAMEFVEPRLNGEDGLGGIFPAMANALMAYRTLGYSAEDPRVLTIRRSLVKLVTPRGEETYVQPCLSPVWDTALAGLAVEEAGLDDAARQACDWLAERQILTVSGDWSVRRPNVAPGGWAFQYRNDFYPDVDDTAVVVMALHRADAAKYRTNIQRAVDWVLGMQCSSGGWAAFDADNEHYHLNSIPFADHGALLDPPTADVTARCLGMLVQLGYDRSHPAIRRAIEFLKNCQEADGSWFGRWGTNYIYGTWSVLSALNAAGEEPGSPVMTRAAAWLEARQQADGGWGESCESYWTERRGAEVPPLASQTAWAVLALMAAGRVDSDAVRRGIDFLTRARTEEGWHDGHYNAVGFPRVFYLKYHGYPEYFPLMALARYRNLIRSNTKRTAFGL